MDDKDILNKIILSGVLGEHELLDDRLRQTMDELALFVSKDKQIVSHGVLHITDFIPATEVKDIDEKRLSLFDDEELFAGLSEQDRVDAEKMKTQIEKVVLYCSVNPASEIKIVTLNSLSHSYLVHCGRNDQQIDIICVIRGKHIPNDVT